MASRGVNRAIILGNLGNDPEIRSLPNGGSVANLSIATSEEWNDKQTGQKQEKTEWHRVVIFGKLADIVGQYLRKGSKVYLEGKLQTRKWQDQQGQDKYTTEIVVDGFTGQLQMLGDGVGQVQQAPQQRPQQPARQAQQAAQPQGGYQQAPQQQSPQQSKEGFDAFDSDVPF